MVDTHRGDKEIGRARGLRQAAHPYCFVAQSMAFEVGVELAVAFRAAMRCTNGTREHPDRDSGKHACGGAHCARNKVIARFVFTVKCSAAEAKRSAGWPCR
jgi:hypothetical protein